MEYDEINFKVQVNIARYGCNLEQLSNDIMEGIADAMRDGAHMFYEDVIYNLSLESLKIDFKENNAVVYASLERDGVITPYVFRWNLH